MRIKLWSRTPTQKLYEQWVSQFDSEEEAIASAIWIANRLVKDKAASTRRKFYSIKDEWLKRHADDVIEGRIARKEIDECWTCDGTGKIEYEYDEYDEYDYDYEYDDDDDDEYDGEYVCPKCCGTGVYQSRHLYEHRLVVAGTTYSFHSYIKPPNLSEEPGADLEQYGGRFTDDEFKELALPMSGLLKVLTVAAHNWGLEFDRKTGRYR